MEIIKMRKKVIQSTSLMLVMGLSLQIHAGELTITNTFQSGTPASAAEVNQNFTDVKTAVDDNDSRISTNEIAISANTTDLSSNTATIAVNTSAINAVQQSLNVYDNTQRIGVLLGVDVLDDAISFLSDTGYIGEYSTNRTRLLFTTADCTGQAYSAVWPPTVLIHSYGLVRNTTNTGGYQKVYAIKASVYSTIAQQSYLNNDTCTVESFNQTALMVYPNDQAITGLPNNFTGPLTISN